MGNTGEQAWALTSPTLFVVSIASKISASDTPIALRRIPLCSLVKRMNRNDGF